MLTTHHPQDAAGLRVSCFQPSGEQFATHWALKITNPYVLLTQCPRLHPRGTDKHKMDLDTRVFIVEFTAGNSKRSDVT